MNKTVRFALLTAVLASGLFLCMAHVIPEGRMTGGGSFFLGAMRITHGLELHCDPTRTPNNLEINWGGGNRFHLEEMTAATCYDVGDSPAPPNAPFTTLYGAGTGRYNGVPGAYANWQFSDHGEPGTKDTVDYLFISDADGNVVLSLPASGGPYYLTFGNHQAHRQNGN